VYASLLRPDQGDSEASLFFPSSDFKFVVVSSNPCPDELKGHFSIIVVDNDAGGGGSSSGDGDDEDAVGALYGATKEIIRKSEELVEAAFDGEIDVVQDQLDKGYHPESCDEHDQACVHVRCMWVLT